MDKLVKSPASEAGVFEGSKPSLGAMDTLKIALYELTYESGFITLKAPKLDRSIARNQISGIEIKKPVWVTPGKLTIHIVGEKDIEIPFAKGRLSDVESFKSAYMKG